MSGLSGTGGQSIVSGLGGGNSVSSKSIRRRDVIRPMTTMENDEADIHVSDVSDVSDAFVLVNNNQCHDEDHIGDVMLDSSTSVESNALILHPSQNDTPQSNAFVLLSPSPKPSTQPSQEQSRQMVNHESSLHHSLQKQPRGMDPAEIIRDKSFIHSDGPSDPPGESPNDRPVVCLDIVPVVSSSGGSVGSGSSSRGSRDSDGSSRGNGGRRLYRNVQWMDPKNVSHESDVDYSVLRHYEQLTSVHNDDRYNFNAADPPSSTPITNALQQTSILLTNPRTRIATISSGYKKANYFVREDLDTRIYFHQLEDAVGYMAKRGYCKMRGEEEREWKVLLGRAHGVVKVGPTKKKQHYRKGKLVLILKKTITDNTTNNNNNSSSTAIVVAKKKKKKHSTRRKPRHSSSHSEASSTSSQATDTSQSTTTTSNFDQSTTCTNNTERTSLGKSIRCGYKSYSEKFLAQQEDEKKRYLLAIMEGRPLDDFGYGGAGNNVGCAGVGVGGEGQLLLTDGSTTTMVLTVDPSADRSIVSSRNGESTAQGGNGHTGTSTKSSSYSTSVNTSVPELKKQQSARCGVYGGGVRYFTPEKSYREEDEDEGTDEGTEDRSTDNEDFEEEDDEDYTQDDSQEQEEEEDASNAVEIEGSDMGSMFSEEESTYMMHAAGVDSVVGSVTTMSTNEQNEVLQYNNNEQSKKNRGSSRRARSPPELAPISDDSASSNSH